MERKNRILEKYQNDENINKLSLNQRKKIVDLEMENCNPLDTENLKVLLKCNNTNEKLIVKYIYSLSRDEAIYELMKYSYCISVNSIIEIEKKKFKNNNLGNRKISYKSMLMNLLFGLKNYDNQGFYNKMNIINKEIEKKTVINNQPFDKDNYEGLYSYICTLFSAQVKKNEKKIDEYLKNLKRLISKFNELKKYYNNNNNKDIKNEYTEENKDFKKFIIVILAVLNLDYSNYDEIFQVASIFNIPEDKEKAEMIHFFKNQLLKKFDEPTVNEFIEKIENNNNYHILNYEFVNQQLRLSEECYSYEYIIENNIYKKYEKEIICLLNVIFKSDLFKEIFKTIYNKDEKTFELIFDNKDTIENFYNNVLIFVPFKLKKISSFSYREISKIFISIYKIRNFNTDIEDELFTLGAFIRTLTHESLGHFIMSSIFFMFYANILEKEKYDFPRFDEQINELKKDSLIESVGKQLEAILQKIINDNKLNEKATRDFQKISADEKQLKENDETLEKKLFEEFKGIIGDEYAHKLAKDLIEKGKNSYNSKIKNFKSKEITDILFQYISTEFKIILNNVHKFKKKDSGNMIEFLLYNDFSQYMTLKECLFLLNEENYKETNLFKFRSAYKNILKINNKNFLYDLKNGNKIFHNLFSDFNSLYDSDSYIENDFIDRKNFRENSGENLNEKYPAFQCFNIKTLDYKPTIYKEFQ